MKTFQQKPKREHMLPANVRKIVRTEFSIHLNTEQVKRLGRMAAHYGHRSMTDFLNVLLGKAEDLSTGDIQVINPESLVCETPAAQKSTELPL